MLPRLGKVEVKRCGLTSRAMVRTIPLIDKYQEGTTQRKAMKYLRESCYHHIKCSATISLAALMRK